MRKPYVLIRFEIYDRHRRLRWPKCSPMLLTQISLVRDPSAEPNYFRSNPLGLLVDGLSL